jgi:hypothetical protein
MAASMAQAHSHSSILANCSSTSDSASLVAPRSVQIMGCGDQGFSRHRFFLWVSGGLRRVNVELRKNTRRNGSCRRVRGFAELPVGP